MSEKKKIIVYGLGKVYRQIKEYIGSKYDIVGYSDKREMEGPEQKPFILPEDLPKYNYDYICVTSNKYFVEIKRTLEQIIGRKNSNKIISLQEAFGDFRNAEVRDKWVIEKIKSIPAGAILLDAGAGEQRYRVYCSHLKYIAQDFGKFVPDEISVGLQQDKWDYTGIDVICDIVDMPLEDASVDAILCTEVFEHIENPMLALREFSRIIKPGGKLILTAPVSCLTHMAPFFFYNGFSEYWYEKHLTDNGFAIKELVSNGNYFKYMCQELFRTANMAERYCGVKLNPEEINTIINSMEIMMRLSEKDSGSDETLCFGKMLVAEKMI